jgi:hypothetical protein
MVNWRDVSAEENSPMNSVYRLMVAAAVSVAAIVSASAETPAGGAAEAPKGAQPPIPTLHCEFKAMSACSPDGDCKEGNEVAGIKVPVKVTVDFENSVVSAVDDTGFARTDKFDGVAETADQLVMHGIDGPFGWQLLLHKSSDAASMSFATADSLIGGFGTCSAK